MSRTRLIRPAFFSDELMAKLPAWTRLVYVGLWTVCDDAGYFDRKPAEIAAELFRWDRPAVRLRRVESSLDQLAEYGRVTYLDCGVHGIVPKLPEYGVMKGGNHSYTAKDDHEKRCLVTMFRRRETPVSRSDKHEYGLVGTSHVSGSGSVSGLGLESGRRGASDSEKPTTTLRDRLVAHRMKPELVG